MYAFSLALCDNEIDRDFERFSTEALEKLQELFLGKTCIFDHEQKSINQTARIYRTALRRDPGAQDPGGGGLCAAHRQGLPAPDPGEPEVIELIDSGILKEVSVSCSVKRSVCGLCGKEQCGHEKGKEYPEGVGHRVLCDPTDAYECSFVAVPAQREAGVTKSFREGELEGLLSGEVTKAQADRLRQAWGQLREKARWGDAYRESLTRDVLRYSALLQPEVPAAVMKSAAQGLSLEELSLLGKTYERMAQRALPLKPQLAPETSPGLAEEDRGFQI